ncbi:MAG: Smr/MutS family protein [Tatlockia sp.]|jgi:DNA-nicking Smr family endonuclease
MSDKPLSPEEKRLFRQMMQGVKPLAPDNKVPVTPAKPAPVKKRASLFPPKKEAESLYLSDYYANPVESDTILSYTTPNLPKKLFLDLRRGKLQWQAKLDLHGLKPEQAKEALVQFIAKQWNLSHRCLLVIHGKGGHKGEQPVLKNLINHWLSQFPEVLAFHSALPKEGGAGALYLLLKRNKLNFSP